MKPSFINDYITTYDDVITPESCDHLIDFFEKNKEHTFKQEKSHMSFRELGLQNFPQYRDETNDLFHSFIEQVPSVALTIAVVKEVEDVDK